MLKEAVAAAVKKTANSSSDGEIAFQGDFTLIS